MNIIIFAQRFFDFENNRPNLGGTQTYLSELTVVFKSAGYSVTLFDLISGYNNSLKSSEWNGVKIHELYYGKQINKSFHITYRKYNNEDTIFIIGDDIMAIKPKGLPNVISIQHGIGWDAIRFKGAIKSKGFLFLWTKTKINLKRVFKFINGANYVCVDHNYYNWIKALYEVPEQRKFAVIPNFSSSQITPDEMEEKISRISDLKSSKIVFARRFVFQRGPLLWARVVKRLITEYPKLSFTFAGEGPYENDIRTILSDYPQVEFTKFDAENSVEFHNKFDIAVVPTIYSEGTSLSACEAMSAACVPVSTCVGGLSNIVIDWFNGRLSLPDEDQFYDVMVDLLEMDLDEFKNMARRSYYSAVTSFSKERWAKQWLNYIDMFKIDTDGRHK